MGVSAISEPDLFGSDKLKTADPLQRLVDLGKNNISINAKCSRTFPNICRRVKKVSLPGSALNILESSFHPVIGDRDKAYLLKKQVGKGTVWIFPENTIALNEHLDKFDNLRLLYQIATRKQRILFDEFHHGYTAPLSGNLKEQSNAIWILIGYIASVLLIIAVVRLIRFGPPLPLLLQCSSGSSEFVSALGLLYYSHGAAGVLEHYLLAWKLRLEKKTGISHRLSNANMLLELIRKGEVAASRKRAVERALADLTSSSVLSEEAYLNSVSELETILEGYKNE